MFNYSKIPKYYKNQIMKIKDFTFLDISRNRQIPICIYLPDITTTKMSVVINSPGYGGGQEAFEKYQKGLSPWPYKQNTYLAKFFTDCGYVFISIQHDIIGDNDGLETLDPNAVQSIARKHLWERGMANILFVIEELKKQNLNLNLDKFIISGHSNGGDIAKYFANHYSKKISHVISLDGRRCPLNSQANIKLLSFEANDTSTDTGVIPNEGTQENPLRQNLEWIIIKPKNAVHQSYRDDGKEEDVKQLVCKTIKWFLNNF
jgi:hypothetical protein